MVLAMSCLRRSGWQAHPVVMRGGPHWLPRPTLSKMIHKLAKVGLAGGQARQQGRRGASPWPAKEISWISRRGRGRLRRRNQCLPGFQDCSDERPFPPTPSGRRAGPHLPLPEGHHLWRRSAPSSSRAGAGAWLTPCPRRRRSPGPRSRQARREEARGPQEGPRQGVSRAPGNAGPP